MSENNYYKPSDDTFLLAECVQHVRGENALEIGVGSGYVSELLAKNFDLVVATDMDLNAIKEAKDKVDLLVCCDSASAIVNVAFDLVVINPPYLPSPEIRDLAVDGGACGIEVAMKMLADAIRLLKDTGTIMFVTSSLSDYNQLLQYVHKSGYATEVIARRNFDFEELFVVKAWLRAALVR